jgi:hypothetical protein
MVHEPSGIIACRARGRAPRARCSAASRVSAVIAMEHGCVRNGDVREALVGTRVHRRGASASSRGSGTVAAVEHGEQVARARRPPDRLVERDVIGRRRARRLMPCSAASAVDASAEIRPPPRPARCRRSLVHRPKAERARRRRGRPRAWRARASRCAEPSGPWYTAYIPAITASSTCAVQMLLVAFSRRMCCSRVCSAMRSAGLPLRVRDTPMMRPGMLRLNSSRVAKNAACGPPKPIGTPKRCAAAHGDVGAPLARRRQQRERQQVGRHA